ncbi:MAG: Rho termination factor N-terminal domain-containing protein, partial [Bacteroidota bacterium]
PEECLNKNEIKDLIKNSNSILEPSAGLGSIMHFIKKINSEAKLTAVEFNEFFSKLLKFMYPTDIIYNHNFLSFDKENDFDLIIMNPPFSKGGDNFFYIDFIFHCLYLLNKKSSAYDKNLIVICPSLKCGESFNLGEFIFKSPMSIKKLSNIVEKYGIKFNENILKYIKGKKDDLNEKEFEEIGKFEDYFDFAQSYLIGKCKNFPGTKFEADIYHFIMYKKQIIANEQPQKQIITKEPVKKQKQKKDIKNEMTVCQLKIIAQQNGFTGYSKLKKAQLVMFLKSKGINLSQPVKIKQNKKNMTLCELKTIAKQKGMKGYSKLTKNELMKKI